MLSFRVVTRLPLVQERYLLQPVRWQGIIVLSSSDATSVEFVLQLVSAVPFGFIICWRQSHLVDQLVVGSISEVDRLVSVTLPGWWQELFAGAVCCSQGLPLWIRSNDGVSGCFFVFIEEPVVFRIPATKICTSCNSQTLCDSKPTPRLLEPYWQSRSPTSFCSRLLSVDFGSIDHSN